jgi:hypothetical protein
MSDNVALPTNTSQTKVLGQDIGLQKSTDLKEQLEELREQFVKTMGKQKSQVDKYRSLQKFNKQLSESYLKNMNVIVDINWLLKAYIEFLDIVKNQTSQIQLDMDKFGPTDFDYIKNLTTEKIFALSEEFKKSAVDLKSLYHQYNMKDEYAKVEHAERQMDMTVQEADLVAPKLYDAAFVPEIPMTELAAPTVATPPLEEKKNTNVANAAKKPNANATKMPNGNVTKPRNANSANAKPRNVNAAKPRNVNAAKPRNVNAAKPRNANAPRGEQQKPKFEQRGNKPQFRPKSFGKDGRQQQNNQQNRQDQDQD